MAILKEATPIQVIEYLRSHLTREEDTSAMTRTPEMELAKVPNANNGEGESGCGSPVQHVKASLNTLKQLRLSLLRSQVERFWERRRSEAEAGVQVNGPSDSNLSLQDEEEDGVHEGQGQGGGGRGSDPAPTSPSEGVASAEGRSEENGFFERVSSAFRRKDLRTILLVLLVAVLVLFLLFLFLRWLLTSLFFGGRGTGSSSSDPCDKYYGPII